MKYPICPLLKKPCIAHDCAWYGHMTGTDPSTGKDMDLWDCSIKWIPILITEQARQTRGVQAAVETMRNENVKASAELNQSFKMAAAIPKLMMDAIANTHVAKPSSYEIEG